MKILIATGLYPPEIGGPATYVKMLETFLPTYKCEVKVVPYRLVSQYPKVFRHFMYGLALWRECNDRDLIMSLDPVSVGLPAMLVAKIRRKKFVLRVPGDYAWEQAQLRCGVTDTLHSFIDKRMSYGWFVSLLCFIESTVAKQAAVVIVPSDYMKPVVVKWGVQPKKIKRIYSALTALEVSETEDQLRKRFGFSGPVILSAGRLVPNKGFRVLISTFAKLKQEYPDAKLVIVGDGPQAAELQALAEEKSVKDSVEFKGRTDKESLGRLIKGADIFVLNTAHEGLSHQLLEVMDLETPIITTPVGGNVELLTNNVEGLLVQYNDEVAWLGALRNLLDDTEKKNALVRNAKLKVANFSMERSISETEQLLKSLS